MGNKLSIKKMNFEDIQEIINKKYECLLINTLPIHNQEYLITNSLRADLEESVINTLLYKNKNKKIIIYGKNSNDLTIYNKYQQLKDLGFNNIYIYPGGLFEWCLLQDIYGEELFKTTSKIQDILKYKPPSLINHSENNYLLTN
jgi:rhodanese-related sulfurtransferase